MRPRGTPPMPSARSSAMDPVGIVATGIRLLSPKRMMAPLPNCLSICAVTSSRALVFSSSCAVVIHGSSSGSSDAHGRTRHLLVSVLPYLPYYSTSVLIFGGVIYLHPHHDMLAFDAHGELPQLDLGIGDAASGGDVVLQRVPGADQNLPFLHPGRTPRRLLARHEGSADSALAERAELMRADVGQRVVPAADIEDADL